MYFRSSSKETIQKALDLNIKVWSLDTNTYGEDDVLIGEYDEALADICYHFEFEKIPDDWTLTSVTSLD